MNAENDTIAAVSTAPGEGGIGIVRISGERAAEILSEIFAAPGKRPGETVFDEAAERIMKYGKIVDPSSAETVDEVLACYMKGPRSYTGEDVCEIQCHGGSVPLRQILGIVCALGAKPAQPGEFTKRAFLNGRIDLVQAGAVIDLIRSKTKKGYHAAKEQAEGRLSAQVREIRALLLEGLANIAVRIDYPEAFEEEESLEEAENIRHEKAFGAADAGRETADAGSGFGQETPEGRGADTIMLLDEAKARIGQLLDGAEAGRMIRDGVRAVIIGRPNTGKSSLFNALVREEAAIVTATPGTTRDVLEVWLDVQGIPVLLTDTAGIRESADHIETIGVERAKLQYSKADIAILLLDGSMPLTEEDRAVARELDPEIKLIAAINKADLPQAFGKDEAKTLIPFPIDAAEILQISLIGDESKNAGKESLSLIEKKIEEFVLKGTAAGSSLLVTKVQQKMLLERAEEEITAAKAAFLDHIAPEFVEINIRDAWMALGELIGDVQTDDIIDKVFAEFCVGK